MKTKITFWSIWFILNFAIWVMAWLFNNKANADDEPTGMFYVVAFVVSVFSWVACYMDLKHRS